MQTATERATGPQPARWTIEEYYRLFNAGLLGERRTELADGVIVEMPQMNAPHGDALETVRDALLPRLPAGCRLAQQRPMSVGTANDRQPDAMVYRPEDRHPITKHPTRPLWVMEISDSTLAYDTGDKLRLYAAAGIPVYWVLDLNSQTLLTYSEPTGDSYAVARAYRDDETVSLPWPAEPIRVADLLP
jgi:Uma2 family endonuclease